MKNLILIAALFVSGILSGQEELNHGDSLWFNGEFLGIYDTTFITPTYNMVMESDCNDEWIEVREHYWTNCYRWEFIDSSSYYDAIKAMVNEYSKYELDSSDTGFIDWLKAKLEDN